MTDEARVRPFHERFEIEVGIDDAKLRFVNRITEDALNDLSVAFYMDADELDAIYSGVAYILGLNRRAIPTFQSYIKYDFVRCLRVLEALYRVLDGTGAATWLSDRIKRAISISEVDLGIDWQPPVFVPTGARLLDERLVNGQLRWLSDPEYRTVYEPFEKGLSHFLETENKSQLLSDVITDMYEALEALAKIVTGRPNKDLSANAEMFISKVKASDHYKKLLKDYITYANEFRHAEQEGKPRPSISRPEVESFVYRTGLFIRLAVQRS